jgi:DNA-binding CsgD family transcriptional regulator
VRHARVADALYEAAFGLRPWQDVLSGLAAAFDAPVSHFIVLDWKDQSGTQELWHGLAPELLELGRKHYFQHDPWIADSFRRLGPAGAYANDVRQIWGQSQVPLRDLPKLGAYYEYVQLVGTSDHLSLVTAWDSTRTLALTLNSREFSGHQAEDIAELWPVFQRAVQINRTLAENNMPSMDSTIMQATPAVFVEEGGNWRASNAEADALLLKYDWMTLQRGKLLFRDRVTDRSFKARVQQVTQAIRSGNDTRRRFPVIVRDLEGRPSGVALIVAEAGTSLLGAMGLSKGKVFALILPEEPRRVYQANALVDMGGLTPSEGELLVNLLAGRSVSEIATSTGRSVATVRWHIRNIFGKLGVSRIDDLHRIAGLIP